MKTAFHHGRMIPKLRGASPVLAAVWLGVSLGAAPAAVRWNPTDSVTIHSRSGQFIVTGPRQGFPFLSAFAARPESALVHLDPAVLAVSCERIKQALLNELEAPDRWRSAFSLVLRPAATTNDLIRITTTRFKDGWTYQMDVPGEIAAPRLVRAIVEVLLREMANRSADTRPAELPPWLVEGLTAHLQATAQESLMLEPRSTTVATGRRADPFAQARLRLREQTPLALDELCWPTDRQLTGARRELYKDCAHLFVYELLHLSNGRALLRTMVAQLPRHLNWQTAFLDAFRPHFPGLLEVDKWWALSLASFTGRDAGQTWPLKASWQKFEEVLRTPVRVRVANDDLPLRTEASLQSIISQWEYFRQVPVLELKIHQLQVIRLRLARELLPLVDDYRLALTSYLQKRNKAGFAPLVKGQPMLNAQMLAQDTINQLNALEARRHALQEPVSATAAPSINR